MVHSQNMWRNLCRCGTSGSAVFHESVIWERSCMQKSVRQLQGPDFASILSNMSGIVGYVNNFVFQCYVILSGSRLSLKAVLPRISQEMGYAQRELYQVFFATRSLPNRLGKRSSAFLPPDYWFLSDYFKTRSVYKKLMQELTCDQLEGVGRNDDFRMILSDSPLQKTSKSGNAREGGYSRQDSLQEAQDSQQEQKRCLSAIRKELEEFLLPLAKASCPWVTPLGSILPDPPSLSRDLWSPLLRSYAYGNIFEALRLSTMRSALAASSGRNFRKAMLALMSTDHACMSTPEYRSGREGNDTAAKTMESLTRKRYDTAIEIFMLVLQTRMMLMQVKHVTTSGVLARSRLFAWEFVYDFIRIGNEADDPLTEESEDSTSNEEGHDSATGPSYSCKMQRKPI